MAPPVGRDLSVFVEACGKWATASPRNTGDHTSDHLIEGVRLAMKTPPLVKCPSYLADTAARDAGIPSIVIIDRTTTREKSGWRVYPPARGSHAHEKQNHHFYRPGPHHGGTGGDNGCGRITTAEMVPV